MTPITKYNDGVYPDCRCSEECIFYKDCIERKMMRNDEGCGLRSGNSNRRKEMIGKVFAVFKCAVYRHECAGIFSSEHAAVDAAASAILAERDSYHEYEVIPFDMDVPVQIDAINGFYSNPLINEPPPTHTVSRNLDGTVISIKEYATGKINQREHSALEVYKQ